MWVRNAAVAAAIAATGAAIDSATSTGCRDTMSTTGVAASPSATSSATARTAPRRRPPSQAVTRGERGRRAAASGLASIAVTATVVNAVVKPLARRRRPDRESLAVPIDRHIEMPRSRSLPSGHSAAAFAFATGVGHVLPREATLLRALAATVAYSRVHTGVHFPGDVVIGSLLGTTFAQL